MTCPAAPSRPVEGNLYSVKDCAEYLLPAVTVHRAQFCIKRGFLRDIQSLVFLSGHFLRVYIGQLNLSLVWKRGPCLDTVLFDVLDFVCLCKVGSALNKLTGCMSIL